jgi:hypothetical protein
MTGGVAQVAELLFRKNKSLVSNLHTTKKLYLGLK